MRDRLRQTLLALVVAVVSVVGLVPVALTVVSIPLIVVWVGIPMLIATTVLARWMAAAGRHAATVARQQGITRPYREFTGSGFFARIRWLLTAPATWRDLLWLFINATAGVVMMALPVVALVVIVGLLAYPLLLSLFPPGLFDRPFGPFVPFTDWRDGFAFWVPAAGLLIAWWFATPALVRGWAGIAAALLGPTRAEVLAGRVHALARSRADTRDSAAAEIRRIERDLHDGVQVHLVSMTMTLGLAEELIGSDPDRARQLIAEVSAATSATLDDLRRLIRGIHPPVLADRGLVGATRALAMQAPLLAEVEVTGFGEDEQARLPAPVEACGYFVIAEALANALRHSQARSLEVRLDYADGLLRGSVRDDGIGGADLTRGSGLAGVARRLQAFDGTLTVDSPPGGPTDVRMEIPCEPLWPRTTPSFEKA